MKNYKTEIFTGMRTTSGMSIANLIGAVEPILKILEEDSFDRPMLFVADLHSITDSEPKETQSNIINVLRDYIAAGLNPEKVDLFIQSQIVDEVSKISLYLSRLITLAELMRVPTLKEKIKKGQKVQNASTLLAFYPIMMAGDILLQGAEYVPVGKDQYVHLEVTCDLVKRFNKKYGEVFLKPKPFEEEEPVNILSLTGSGKKMSKTEPNGAIILDDEVDVSLKKIKKAKTAFAGEMNEDLKSLKMLADYVSNSDDRKEFDNIIKKHMQGEQVMGDFKSLLMDSLEKFIIDFQGKKKEISEEYILNITKEGAQKAKENARDVLKEMEDAMGMKYV